MIVTPNVAILVAWFLVGPLNMHHLGESTFLLPMLTLSVLSIAVLAKGSSKVQSVALLIGLGVMFYQSLLTIGGWLHFDVGRPEFLQAEGVRHFFSLFFALNVGLAVVGSVAALAFAISLEFRNLRLSLAQLFPEMTFVAAPHELTVRVERLSAAVGVESPQVSVIDSGSPAAFVTSSMQGCVLAVSVGLLESLHEDELDACLVHELSHLKNNDFTVRSFATAARIALFAHPLSHLIEPAFYRTRELLADRIAAEHVGRDPMISTLTKLRESQRYVEGQLGSTGVACLFNSPARNRLIGLFDKHPTLDARIRALRELEMS
jgi:heat shock protein HtpX